MRLVIGGGPRTGKTTLARSAAREMKDTKNVLPLLVSMRRTTRVLGNVEVLHADSFISQMEWSEVSERVAEAFDWPGPWVIEGVATVRALRKWLKNNAEGTPCDRMIWCSEPFEKRNKGQESMAKGCETIWAEVEPLLAKRGVEIVTPISGDA